MESNYKVVNVPLKKDNENLKKVARLEQISRQNSSSGSQRLREVITSLINNCNKIYVAKLKDEIIGCITYKKGDGDSLSMDSYYIADRFKGNGVGRAIRARAIRDTTKENYKARLVIQ